MPNQEKDHEKASEREKEKEHTKEQNKEGIREKSPVPSGVVEPSASSVIAAVPKGAAATEEEASHYFFGEPLVGFDPAEITGTLVVIEGMDGSGRSTQITLLQEWLESEGFAVQTSGLRRSNLVGERYRPTPG
jgi:hypothetical protein